ncbi:hypothetical protein ACQPZP_37370 [Spirillospora sp. CA-142024]|uniref:hypothetical protein n=1 Tax=Spirillospora sp. CA-142024 TaxID=3240036 RepID=UPI003D8CF3CE
MTAQRVRPAFGIVLAAAGAVLWATALAFVVPAARTAENAAMAVDDAAQEIPNDRWLSLWVHDLRWAAIIVIVCGLALTACGTGHRKHAAVVAGIVLLVADGTFTAMNATRWPAMIGALVAASAIAAATMAAQRTDTKADGPQRHLVGYGIVAAWCAPLLLSNAMSGVGRFVPDGLAAGASAAQVLLVLAAIACAVSAMPHVPRGAVPAAAGFTIVLGTAGAFAGANGDVVWALLLGGPLVVAVLLLTSRPRSARSFLGLAIIAVGYPFAALAAFLVGMGPAMGALALSGDSYPADGVAALPGGLLAGAVAGVLTVWTRRGRRPAPPI